MSKYKIRMLYIENFKLIDEALIDFEESNLILLDGPNGFGKTTIFDAIELIITKKINRNLDASTTKKSEGFEHWPYHKSGNKDLILSAEFIDENSHVFTVIRRLSCKTSNSKLRRPDNFDGYEIYQYGGSIYDDITSQEPNFQDKLLKHYSKRVNNIIVNWNNEVRNDNSFEEAILNFYNLFYYIEQENNTYYLKLNEEKRMEEIDSLFSTGDQKQELDKISTFLAKVIAEHKNMKNRIEGTEDRLKEIEEKIKNNNSGEIVEYEPLLKSFSIDKSWDMENIEVTEANKANIDKEIQDLEHYVKYCSDYKADNFNKELDEYLGKRDVIERAIVLGFWIKDNEKEYKYMLKKYNDQKSLGQFLNDLQKESILDKVNDNTLDKIKNIIGENHNYEAIKISIKGMQLKRKGAGEISKIAQKMSDTRNALLKIYEEAKTKTKISPNECPMCGYKWDTYDELLKNIDDKKRELDAYFDSTSKEIEDERDQLFISHIDALLSSIKQYKEKKENIIKEDFFQQIEKAYKQKVDAERFISWCLKNKIDIINFYNESNEVYSLIDAEYEKVIGLLRNERKAITKDFKQVNKLADVQLKNIFDSCFGGKEENIKLVSLEQIKAKKKYIDNMYFSAKIKEKNRLEKELRTEEEKLAIIEKWTRGTKPLDQRNNMPLQEIVSIYVQEISSRHKKLITDVEIPFYIFSGKILQTYQRGMGVFLSTREDKGTTKCIRFVSDLKNNHDVIHCMSSGQLSGVIMAWTLALNKVYSENSNLYTILIDDPVQTMDDINMASLVDLLRNEFSDRQLIISTHEDYVSKYMRYKFRKSGLTEKCINVKEKLA